MNQEELIAEIEAAFSGVQRPETSLRQFKITDEKGMSQEISDAEWEAAGQQCTDMAWQDISDSELEECGCQLAHMQGNEFVYYLPAYMRHSVRHYQRPVWEDTFVGFTVSSLKAPPQGSNSYYGLAEYVLEQHSRLNAKHVNAIIAFLKFVAAEGHATEKPDAAHSLDYWLRYQST